LAAGKAAARLGIPIVLDPVGVGATTLRTQVAHELLQTLPITIVRGNLGEIMCLATQTSAMKGVDSQEKVTITPELARHAAKSLGTVVAITGKFDAISDGKEAVLLENGHEMLTRVTGTGCMTTSLVASFAAVTSPLLAAVGGIMTMGLAGELAVADLSESQGVGTFRMHLFDHVYSLTGKTIQAAGRVLYHG
jgi:hydroxyethylthiazole kinase